MEFGIFSNGFRPHTSASRTYEEDLGEIVLADHVEAAHPPLFQLLQHLPGIIEPMLVDGADHLNAIGSGQQHLHDIFPCKDA